ncbi:response regulator transcription factor [Streptomyces sp. SYSU K21746]
MIRVLVVDDEELVRSALRRILDSADGITTVGGCDGHEATETVRKLAPDVVLLDIGMPSKDGLSVLRELRALPRPPVVAMLTALDTDAHVDAALRDGASGFLLKTTEPRLFIDAVRLLAAGGAIWTPGVSARVMSRYAGTAPVAAPRELAGLETLTDRERQVLALIAAGLANGDIATHLGMGVTTVKTHVGALKRKLAVPNRVALAAAAHRASAAAESGGRAGSGGAAA